MTTLENVKNKYGVDTITLMLKLLPLMGVVECKRLDKKLNSFISFLVQQTKRGITEEEKINLYEGLLRNIKSEPGSDEREESLIYLFSLKFLND